VTCGAWPNGGGEDLAPADYYLVRFVAAHGTIQAGAIGAVVEHVLLFRATGTPARNCVVEVGPWGPHGDPVSVQVVPASVLEMLPAQPLLGEVVEVRDALAIRQAGVTGSSLSEQEQRALTAMDRWLEQALPRPEPLPDDVRDLVAETLDRKKNPAGPVK